MPCSTPALHRAPRRARYAGRLLAATLPAIAAAMASGCTPEPPAAAAAPTFDTRRPAPALAQLTRHLQADDLEAFARDGVPPALHARLQVAWREGRTRWPLDELPLDAQYPQTIAALAADGADAALLARFDGELSGAGADLRAAANVVGRFATQYVQQDGDYGDEERDHHAQLVSALTRWGTGAPLGDRARADVALRQLTAAARALPVDARLATPGADMTQTLRAMGSMVGAAKEALRGYGLDLDAALAGAETTLTTQTGDSAQVRLRYALGGQQVDAMVPMLRRDGRWYVADHLRRAEAAASGPPPAPPGADSDNETPPDIATATAPGG